MQTHLTREEYAAEIRFRLGRFMRPEHLRQVLAVQYPKPTDTATRELRFRGLEPGPLPERLWYATEIDAAALALESSGLLSAEALECRSRGIRMEDLRLSERCENADGTFTVFDIEWGLTPEVIHLDAPADVTVDEAAEEYADE